jgi:hypothetical protein
LSGTPSLSATLRASSESKSRSRSAKHASICTPPYDQASFDLFVLIIFTAQCLLDLDRRAGIAMANETKPANDNQDAGIADLAARDKLDKVVLSIARLIGRQIAREHFETLRAANDNAVRAPDIQEDGE